MKKNIIFILIFLMLASSVSALTAELISYKPVNILSGYTYDFSAGEKVPVKFSYNYSCPLAYAIDIYEDTDLSNSVCTKIVNGMGWIITNTYSGIVCQNISATTVIEDVCGISSDAKDGSYTVRVTLFDKNNKPSVFDSKVSALNISTNKPDLIPLIELSDSLMTGQTIPIKVKAVNSGKKDALPFTLSLYLNSGSGKTLIGEKKVLGLAQNETKEVLFEFNSVVFPGTHVFEAVIDSQFEIEEQNENNNLLQKEVLFNASSDYPDLIISSLDFVESVNQGEELPVTAVILNNGLTEVASDFVVSLLDSDGKIIESEIVYGLNSGEQIPVTFFVSSLSLSGTENFSISIDKLNLINEATKNNNSDSFSFNVVSSGSGRKELCYNGLDDDLDGKTDEDCKTDYSVELSEFIFSSSNEKVFPVIDLKENKKFRFDSKQIPSFIVIPFNIKTKIGENKDYFTEFSSKSFCVNVSDEKKEKELILVFSGKKDSFNSDSLLEFIDSSVNFSYLFTVNGKQKALPKSYVSSLYSWSLTGKDNSGFYFMPKILGFDSGETEIKITSDCFEREADGNPFNDSDSLFLKVVSKEEENGIDDDDDGVIDNGFDLSLESFSFEKDVLLEKEDSKALLTVTNNGKFISPQVKVYFFSKEINEKNIIFSDLIGSINPKETQEFSFIIPYSLIPEVENTIFAFVDFDNSFAESNELNNDSSALLFKYSNFVSLKISEANFDRKLVSPGTNVGLTAKIQNNGFVDSSSFFVIVRDSLTNEIVDSVKVSNLKAGITLQNLSAKEKSNAVYFSELNFDDLSNVTVNYDYIVPGDLIGNRNYDVCISSTEDVEGIDSDNCTKIFLLVSQKSDLTVNYFRPVNDSLVELGNSVLLELEIENKGVLNANNFTVQLYYYQGETKKVINTISGFNLASGEKQKVMLSVDFSKEITGSIFAELDSENSVEEDNKTNNIVSINLYSFLVEKCYNAIDDDLDGLIDESCPKNQFVIVSDEAIKEQFVFDVMQEEIIEGSLQKVVLYHSLFGPVSEQKITIISPSKEVTELTTDSEGSISFLAEEKGNYEVMSSIKSVVFTDSFKVISKEQAEYSFIFLIADFLFGPPEQTNPLVIPIILLLSLIVSAYAFSKFSRHCVALWDMFILKPDYGIACSLIASAVFFFVVLFSNRFFGLIGFFIALILEFILIYLFEQHFIKKNHVKQKEITENNKKEIESNQDKEKTKKKKKKGKFMLRL